MNRIHEVRTSSAKKTDIGTPGLVRIVELPCPGDTKSPGSHADLQPVLLNVWSHFGHHVLYWGCRRASSDIRKIRPPAGADDRPAEVRRTCTQLSIMPKMDLTMRRGRSIATFSRPCATARHLEPAREQLSAYLSCGSPSCARSAVSRKRAAPTRTVSAIGVVTMPSTTIRIW